MRIESDRFGDAWYALLHRIYQEGQRSAPRGHNITELLNVTLHVRDARENILVHPARKLSYRFAVAEWLWIWFGCNDVASIAQYNPNIAQFSDDGVTFAGAYGPHVNSQWDRVIDLLMFDSASRQAVISIYTPLGPTRDVPCTLTMQLLIRDGALHGTVNMRSSDIWLGLPYDFFTFGMLCNIAAAQLGVKIGSLTYNLASSHLYDVNRDSASYALITPLECRTVRSPALPGRPPSWMLPVLQTRTRLGVNVQPWSRYVDVLTASKNSDALEALRRE